MKTIAERLIRYAEIETTSDTNSGVNPSTETQRGFAQLLKEELKELGVEASIDEHSVLMAKLPSNMEGKKVPAIGFISHLDTAPDASGKNVKPIYHENFDGYKLRINKKMSISPKTSADLGKYIGDDIITSDGTTLLGADDKAGIAAIITAIEYFVKHPEIKHGDICIAFTPDEEIGEGGGLLDVEAFGADFAFTVDGETLGEFNYETFNAAEVKVTVNGYNVHPGSAKGRMINACEAAAKLATLMPIMERPEYTDGYDGFFHLCEMSGSVEKMEMIYIIRDFDKEKFESKKAKFHEVVEQVNGIYGKGVVEIDIEDEYANMREVLEEKTDIIDLAKKAYEEAGVDMDIRPIRGGTDGATLSFRGLPCPNIFVGGNNFHSVAEFVSVEAMEKASEIVVKIAEINAR